MVGGGGFGERGGGLTHVLCVINGDTDKRNEEEEGIRVKRQRKGGRGG